jgi:transposase InsO family protein
VALAAAARFVIDLRLGPRTLESARELLASVAGCCRPGQPLLIEADEHRPYPQAILDVFGVTRFGRRRHARGRRKHPTLKPPPGLLVGVVHKRRDERGNLLGVTMRRLFGRRHDILKVLKRLNLGRRINTGHVERLNGTMRTQQTRLARRTRNVSHAAKALHAALMLWRDLYHWTRPHGSLHGRTPAMALGLAKQVWSAGDYVHYPVHVGDGQRALWAEQRETLLTAGLNRQKHRKPLPTS